MDEEVARIVAAIESQLKDFSAAMETAQREADKGFAAVESRMRLISGAFNRGLKDNG